jgi:2-keto-4-pentenoate hydratase
LVWLANHAARQGRGIAAGDIVTTGSHTGLTFANSTSRITARFPGLGESHLEIAGD